jgi:hypothetical protein
MRDLLIRYLLGELDDAEQRQLEERLQENPELRRELEYLRGCFAEGPESTAATSGEPPAGLAQRTAEQVGNLSDDSAVLPSPAYSPVEPPAGSMSWSLADISVAAGVFLAVSMLLLPALRGSRDTSRKAMCANNLRQIGQYLFRYAEKNNGYVPRVGSHDPAGVFAVKLVRDDYVAADEMRRLLLCPASKQRDAYVSGRVIIAIPACELLKSAQPAEIELIVRKTPCSYAYRFGYVENNRYHNACMRNRPRPKSCEPIMADAPRFDESGPTIANHNGCGLNVLNADWSVRFQKCLTVAGLDDLLFLNNHNKAAAGRGPFDVVLGVSDATPRVEVIEATPAD